MSDVGPILLVEDNQDDVDLTLRALRRANLANPVEIARDGVEALDRLLLRGKFAGEAPPVPAIILLDLKLPRVDGFEVLTQLRANRQTRLLPVVILTSSIEEEDRARGYTLGANSYIRKPVDFEQFIESVRQLGLYWLMLNESPPRA